MKSQISFREFEALQVAFEKKGIRKEERERVGERAKRKGGKGKEEREK